LPGFQRTRLLGEAMGRFLNTLNKRVLILGSGGLAAPLPGFQRTRLLGEAMGRFLNTLNKRVLILGSGGL
ncbi:hypothetical protein CQA88_32190, partial [Klebsiella pneumoniae]